MAVQTATSEYKKLKKEVSRMASLANKRIARLERNELTDLPAYQSWVEGGSIKFSVAGKDYKELQREFWRLKNFIDNKTSTVRGAMTVLRDIAKNTGIKVNSVKELKKRTTKFFEIASKIEQYYKSIGESAISLDYQKIWEQINQEVEKGKITLDETMSTDEILNRIISELNLVTPVEKSQQGFRELSNKWDFVDI